MIHSTITSFVAFVYSCNSYINIHGLHTQLNKITKQLCNFFFKRKLYDLKFQLFYFKMQCHLVIKFTDKFYLNLKKLFLAAYIQLHIFLQVLKLVKKKNPKFFINVTFYGTYAHSFMYVYMCVSRIIYLFFIFVVICIFHSYNCCKNRYFEA